MGCCIGKWLYPCLLVGHHGLSCIGTISDHHPFLPSYRGRKHNNEYGKFHHRNLLDNHWNGRRSDHLFSCLSIVPMGSEQLQQDGKKPKEDLFQSKSACPSRPPNPYSHQINNKRLTDDRMDKIENVVDKLNTSFPTAKSLG